MSDTEYKFEFPEAEKTAGPVATIAGAFLGVLLIALAVLGAWNFGIHGVSSFETISYDTALGLTLAGILVKRVISA